MNIKKTGLRLPILILTILLLLVNVPAAMPPHPHLKNKIDSGQLKDPSTKLLPVSTPQGMPRKMPLMSQSPTLSGTFKTLCILVDFSDNTASTSALKFDSLIFVGTTTSVHKYYDEVSYNQIDFVTVNLPSALGWKRAPQTYAYYVNNDYGIGTYPYNSQKLCEDLVDLVNSSVDFSQYDNNSDGYVDGILIAHAGPGAEFTGETTDIWSHQWGINIPLLRDGVYIQDYSIMPEYWIASGDMTIGVYCHEIGHLFGLPDLYDTDYSSEGVGQWSIMAAGSWNGGYPGGDSPANLDAWCKYQLGWLTPTNITSNQSGVSIPNSEQNAVAYQLWTSGAPGTEYFLVENRQKIGYDAALPGSGLLIWHVDETRSDNDNEWYPGHTTSGHYLVALEQADGTYQMEQGYNQGNGGDPYPGTTSNTAFTSLSSPNSNNYAGSNTLVAVTAISASASTMTADFAVSLSAAADDNELSLPQFSLSQNYPNPFNPDTRINYCLTSGGNIQLNIYNLLGQHITQIASGYHPAGTYSALWNGTDTNGKKVASGVYLYELVQGDQRTVHKMILMK